MSARLTIAALALGFALAAAPAVASSGQGAPQPEQPTGHHDREEHAPPSEEAQESGGAGRAEQPDPGSYPREPVVLGPVTAEDRAAAFPELLDQHTVHDRAVHSFVLFDRAEWQHGDGADALSLDSKGWIGGDTTRLWFRAEVEGSEGEVEDLETHVLYGRMIARWWDVVGGIRQDFRPGTSRTWAAIGLQGLAPYWFEVEATAYIAAGGRTHFRFATEYELLLTNWVILQPLVQVEIHGRSDPEHGIGAGLSTVETGLRLRYEFKREFAPYVGVVWNRKLFGTADLAEAAGEDTGDARVAAGVRFWF